MKLLVVEDELRMLELLRRGLSEEGHAVICSSDGADAWTRIHQHSFDAVILDIMLPRMDGFELARRIRQDEILTPILMLTAKDSESDIVKGLDLGADEYMVKPFSFAEMLLRLRAVTRRATVPQREKLEVGDLLLDPVTHQVTRGGQNITLTRTEYRLLERLMSNAGTVVPRESLLMSVWGRKLDIEENTLDAFMRLLRNKIDDPSRRRLIHTVRGVGYMLRPEVRA